MSLRQKKCIGAELSTGEAISQADASHVMKEKWMTSELLCALMQDFVNLWDFLQSHKKLFFKYQINCCAQCICRFLCFIL